MTTILHISIWKKETGQCFTDILEESIELKEGDSYKIGAIIEAIEVISKK